jgi:GntR family transcriptional regulator
MKVVFDPNRPIYLQIVQMIRKMAIARVWLPGSKISSVRDLAVELGVNPNTVQRALLELERDGLLYSERTAGRFIATDQGLLEKLRSDLAARQIENFLTEMTAIGYEKRQILEILQQKWSDYDGHD